MSEIHGWLPDARLAWTFVYGWLSIVAAHALWRSFGEAPVDPIRPSGPID